MSPARAAASPAVRIVPANEASWEDLQAVFGARGDPARCQCQRYKMRPRESWASVPTEEFARRLRAQTGCGRADAPTWASWRTSAPSRSAGAPSSRAPATRACC